MPLQTEQVWHIAHIVTSEVLCAVKSLKTSPVINQRNVLPMQGACFSLYQSVFIIGGMLPVLYGRKCDTVPRSYLEYEMRSQHPLGTQQTCQWCPRQSGDWWAIAVWEHTPTARGVHMVWVLPPQPEALAVR